MFNHGRQVENRSAKAGRSLEVESKGLITVSLNPDRDYVISEYDYAIIITKKGKAAPV